MDLSQATGRAMARTQATWARHEVEKQIERSRDEKKQRRQRGMAYGGRYPCFGYRRAGAGKLEIEDDEADAIRYGAQLVLSGKTFYHVAQEWNAKGFTGREGKPFNGLTVLRVLTNATVAAVMEPTRSDPETREGSWEKILDYDTVKAIRQLAADRDAARPGTRSHAGRKAKYLLTGMLECGVCGSRHVHVRAGAKGRRVYACLGAWWDKPNPPPGVGKNHLARTVDRVDAYITGLVLDKIEAQAAARMLTDRGEDVVALRANLAELEARRAARHRDMVEGLIDGKDWAKFTAVVDPQIEDARAAVARALGPPAPAGQVRRPGPRGHRTGVGSSHAGRAARVHPRAG